MSNQKGGYEREALARGGLLAVLAAVAFGLATPFVQRFGHGAGAFSVGSLLYAGAAVASLGRSPASEAPVLRRHLGRLVAVAILGALIAPASLAWGLQHTSASAASLLLNFEAAFTALLAWRLYEEPIGRRVVFALLLMTAGGTCLVLGAEGIARIGWGAALVVLATLAWSIDNVLTRPLANLDPTRVVRVKATLGSGLGLVVALFAREAFPRPLAILGLLLCGAAGYGLSLRLYLLAQRRIGAARTASIFAVGPFVGALAAWVLGDRSAGVTTALAAALFAGGVYLHLTEGHHHRHRHQASITRS